MDTLIPTILPIIVAISMFGGYYIMSNNKINSSSVQPTISDGDSWAEREPARVPQLKECFEAIKVSVDEYRDKCDNDKILPNRTSTKTTQE